MSEITNEDGDLFGLPDDPEERRKMLEEAANLPEDRWAPQLTELVVMLEGLFKRRKIAPEDGFHLAREIVIEMADHFGGHPFYLPRGDRLKVAMRDAEIWRRHNGRTDQVFTLAKQYGVSSIHMYAIIARQRKLHLDRFQGSLFPNPKT